MQTRANRKEIKMEVEKRLFTEKEAAKYLNVSLAFLRMARSQGNLGGKRSCPPFVRFGRMIRYDPVDLNSWIEASKEIST